MAIETGIARQIRWKRQTAKGTIAGTSGGQIQRRTDAKFKLNKEQYTTEDEKTSTQQLISNRHGIKLVDAMMAGIWSPGTWSDPLSAVLRRDFAAITPISVAALTIAGTGPTYTLTRGGGSFLTDGAKVGYVCRLTAGAFNAANLNKNLLVTAVTATVLTVMVVNGSALVAEGPISTTTVTFPGKTTFMPPSGHTAVYYTVEDWSPSVPYSERSTDVRFLSAELKLPGTGNATVSFTGSGLDQTNATTVYFPSPTAETTSEACTAASGLLLENGTVQAVITDLSITLDGKPQPADGTISSNLRADIFRGKLIVKGSMTGYFDAGTLNGRFVDETVSNLIMVLPNSTAAAADFIALAIPRIDIVDSDRDDAETGQKRTYQFTAEYNSAGGAGTSTEQTTIAVQDSLAA